MSEKYVMTPYETREILFYKTDNGDVRVEILLYQENLWLTQAKMAELFEVQKAAISKHLKNIFESGELLEESVVSKMETTDSDGKRYNINYYNLDAIIAVGYRVNSRKATMFRIWANRILKEFIIKGYVMDAERQARRGNVMYMRDWVERLDASLQFNEEDILHDKGKVTAAIAKAFAESEFEKFRVLQDRTYQSDFDRLVAAVEDKYE